MIKPAALIAILALALPSAALGSSRLTFKRAHKEVAAWKAEQRQLGQGPFKDKGCVRKTRRRIDCIVITLRPHKCGNRLVIRKSLSGKVTLVRRDAPPVCSLGDL